MSVPQPSTPVAVFCAFAQPDLPSCLKLEEALKPARRQRVLTLWHEGHIPGGMDRTQTIEAQFSSATLILLLISPDFLASDECDALTQRALERHTAGEAHVIPILLRPAALQGTPVAGIAPLPTNLRPISRWRDKDAAFADVVTGIRRTIDDLGQLALKQAEQGLSRRSQQVWTVPYPPNPLFTGREDLLAQLTAAFRPGQQSWQPQALSGLGGVGKTHLAVEYASRHRADYQAVLWARAESREDLTTSLLALAEALHLPECHQHNATLTLQAITHWLERERGWLLILDNADDLDLVSQFLPPTLGSHLLLTTRAQSMGRLAHKLDVEPFTPELGAQFLLRRATILAQDAPLEQASAQDRTLALQITHDLGGLPLALDQAGAYIEETGCTLAAYLQLYQSHRPTLLSERRSRIPDHPEPVATTWKLAFDRLQADQPAAIDLLRLCTYLSPDTIPEELLTSSAPHLGDQLAPVAADPLLLNAAIENLRAYSFLGRSRATQTLSIHRLVQAVLEDTMDEPTRSLWTERAVRVVNAAFPYIEFASWPQCERLLPQALACAEHIEHRQMMFPQAARLLNDTAYYLDDRSRYSEAESLYKQALAIDEKVFGPEHPEVATDLNNLALLYRHQGKYEQAESLYKRALAMKEKILGSEHRSTATSLNNLAELYRAQSKYEQAEPLYERALAIRERHLGSEHPDTASSLNNLAELYATHGKYEQAEPLYERALTVHERHLGPEHPHTAASLNNLAALYRAQSKYEKALGPEHPDVAIDLNNLALLYQKQDKYEQAEPLLRRALAICKLRLGPEHPNTHAVQSNYDALLRVMGKRSG